jgi:hypothetical protein
VPSDLHLNGRQATTDADLQFPRPSQVEPVTDICVAALHVSPEQTSPLG